MSQPTAIAAPADDTPNRSLIESAAKQLSLPGLPTEADWEATEAKTEFAEGEYTGERLFLRAPQVYRAITELLAASVPIRTIAHLLHTHVKTIMGVREREGLAIATAKERISNRLLAMGQLTVEIIRDQLAEIAQSGRKLKVGEIKDLGILLGIDLEKAMLMGGQATSRVEVVTPTPSHDDWNALVRDVTAEVKPMGSGTETPAQKEAASASVASPDPAGSAPGVQEPKQLTEGTKGAVL